MEVCFLIDQSLLFITSKALSLFFLRSQKTSMKPSKFGKSGKNIVDREIDDSGEGELFGQLTQMKIVLLLIIFLSTTFHYSYGGRSNNKGRNKDDDNKYDKDNNKDKEEEEDGKDEGSSMCNFMDNHFTGERGILLIRTPLWGWSNTFDHWRESLLLAGKRIFCSCVTCRESNSYLNSSFPLCLFYLVATSV